MNCKNTPKHDIGADVVFLRSKRLTGRLAVVIVSVKPFAKIVGCYLCHNRDNEFCYELQGIHSLLAEV